jgi:hypothetical protein
LTPKYFQECANPEICSQFHLYPEINTNGSISEIWHGKKLLEELDPNFLTPMFEMQNGIHYYIHEVAKLNDGRCVIPIRWLKVDSVMHVDTYAVEIDDQVCFSQPSSVIAADAFM